MREFSIVVALDAQSGIGKDGGLPWHLPGDIKFFREMTSKAAAGARNAVIMGRTTWESIPEKFRPLAKRLNVVLTRRTDMKFPEGVLVATDFSQAFELIEKAGRQAPVERIFVIGGAKVYRAALSFRECRTLFVTQIDQTFDCDTYFPDFKPDFELKDTSVPWQEGAISYVFCTYQRKSV
jgi:dihydrofolate reductase/thymidylate synthase